MSEEVINKVKGETPVVVKFTASWCGPCHKVQPLLEAECSKRNIELVLVDVDEEAECAQEYEVNAMPTILVCKKGEIGRVVGGNMVAVRELLDKVRV
jgi:thioredoxin 1